MQKLDSILDENRKALNEIEREYKEKYEEL